MERSIDIICDIGQLRIAIEWGIPKRNINKKSENLSEISSNKIDGPFSINFNLTGEKYNNLLNNRITKGIRKIVGIKFGNGRL